ncbi:MAG: hypothetical protein ABJF01_23105 [bacterium]
MPRFTLKTHVQLESTFGAGDGLGRLWLRESDSSPFTLMDEFTNFSWMPPGATTGPWGKWRIFLLGDQLDSPPREEFDEHRCWSYAVWSAADIP